MEETEKRLADALLNAAMTAKNELNYNPSLFLRMFESEGGLQTAKKLLSSKTISDGFTKLWELRRLDLTVEAIILKDEWISLFSTQELQTAENRLRDAGYQFNKFQVVTDTEKKNIPWTKDELKASVIAYLEMLKLEGLGIKYNKSEINEKLRNGALNKRSKSSVELRMQNLSAVMESLCLPRVNGYLPAKNIGSNVTKVILEILEEAGFVENGLFAATEDPLLLDERVNKLIPLIDKGAPHGNKSPEKQTTSTTVYKRDPLVKAWVLKNSNGKCEKCNSHGPFLTQDDTYFLEVHHIVALAENGEDTIENAVALCPNCHRELHHSKNKYELIEELTTKVARLI